MWNTFIGNFNVEHKLEIISSEHKNLTLSNTKQGTDLGMLVVPFDYKPSTHYINSKPMWMVNTSRFFQNTVVSWASCHEVKFLFEQVFVQSCKPPSFFGTNIPTPEYLFSCMFCNYQPVMCKINTCSPSNYLYFCFSLETWGYLWVKPSL